MGHATADWLPADTVASLLSVSPNALHKRGRRSRWQRRERANPNGGKPLVEYHVSALPEAARVEMARRAAARLGTEHAEAALVRQAGEIVASAKRESAAAALASLAGADADVAHARLAVVTALGAFRSASGLAEGKAREAFARLYNEGRIEVADDVRRACATVSARTLARWVAALKTSGPAALAPSYGTRSARVYASAITEDNAYGEFVLGRLYERGRLVSAETMHEGAVALAAAGELPPPVPSVRTFQRHLAWLERERPAVWAHLVEPHRARGMVMPAFGSASEAFTRANQRWEVDSTLADVLLHETDPATGETRRVRYHLLACVDVVTRRALFHVSARSRAVAIAALLRKAVLAWGVPESVKMDNGKDYTSRHVEGVLAALEVRRELCPPFTPQAKPHVERLIGTFQRQWLTLLDGYVGASVAERKSVEARRQATAAGEAPMQLGEVPLSPSALQQLADEWADGKYLHAAHAGLNGMSPFEAARRAHSAGAVQRIQSERALDVLLAKPAGRKGGLFSVGKKGIQYLPPTLAGSGRTFHFTHPALVADDRIGREVLCLEEDGDIGRLFVFDPASNAFLCVAECAQLTGTSQAEAAALGNAAYREKKREIMATAKKAAQQHSSETVLDHVRAHASGQVKVAGSLGPATPHETPALAAGEAAADALATRQRGRAQAPHEATDADWAEAERLAAGAEARDAAAAAEADRLAAEAAAMETAPAREAVLYDLGEAQRARRYRDDSERYVALLDRLAAGDPLSAPDADFLTRYEASALGAAGNAGPR